MKCLKLYLFTAVANEHSLLSQVIALQACPPPTYFTLNALNSGLTEFHSVFVPGYRQHHSVKHLNFSCSMIISWHFLGCSSFCYSSSPSERAFYALICPSAFSALFLLHRLQLKSVWKLLPTSEAVSLLIVTSEQVSMSLALLLLWNEARLQQQLKTVQLLGGGGQLAQCPAHLRFQQNESKNSIFCFSCLIASQRQIMTLAHTALLQARWILFRTRHDKRTHVRKLSHSWDLLTRGGPRATVPCVLR